MLALSKRLELNRKVDIASLDVEALSNGGTKQRKAPHAKSSANFGNLAAVIGIERGHNEIISRLESFV